MPSLKEIRIRIESVKSTMQITSAMRLVSASKLRKAQNVILKLRPYNKKLNQILSHLKSSVGSDELGYLFTERTPEKILIIPVSSNRGLCGPFNANIIKQTVQLISDEYSLQHAKGNLELITIGKKVTDFFTKRKYKVLSSHDHLLDKSDYNAISQLSDEIIRQFKGGKWDRILLIFNQFVNPAVQKVRVFQYLPVLEEVKSEVKTVEEINYMFQPDKSEILENLIPQSLKSRFYSVITESVASEHGARMTSMQKATDNANELTKELKLIYGKARQATITKELIEIVTASEAAQA